MGYFCGYFASPTALLVYACIDAHKVHARQIDRIALVRNSPVNIKRTASDTIVWMTVGIAIFKGLLYPVCAFPVGVISIIGQARTDESECGIREPFREILLRVEGIFVQITRLVLVVCPVDIGSVGEGVFLIGLRGVVYGCAVVG